MLSFPFFFGDSLFPLSPAADPDNDKAIAIQRHPLSANADVLLQKRPIRSARKFQFRRFSVRIDRDPIFVPPDQNKGFLIQNLHVRIGEKRRNRVAEFRQFAKKRETLPTSFRQAVLPVDREIPRIKTVGEDAVAVCVGDLLSIVQHRNAGKREDRCKKSPLRIGAVEGFKPFFSGVRGDIVVVREIQKADPLREVGILVVPTSMRQPSIPKSSTKCRMLPIR